MPSQCQFLPKSLPDLLVAPGLAACDMSTYQNSNGELHLVMRTQKSAEPSSLHALRREYAVDRRYFWYQVQPVVWNDPATFTADASNDNPFYVRGKSCDWNTVQRMGASK